MQKVLLPLLIAISFLVADDWPQWRGNNGDGIVSVKRNIPVKWPESGLPVLWRAKSGAGYSGISVANSRAYTLCGIESDVYCTAYACDTGKIIWKKRVGKMFTSSWGDGPRSTPTFHENKIYTIGSRGELWCLNAEDGTSIWHVNLLKKFTTSIPHHGFAGSPIIYKNKVLYNVGGPKNAFVAFDKNSGEVIWQSANDKAAYSTPLIAKIHNMDHAVFFSASGAVGVNPDNGNVLWRYPWTTSYNVHAASPIVHKNKVFISSGYSSGSALFAIKQQQAKFTTEKIWETQKLKNHFSSSILFKEHLYGFHNSILTCIDLKNGKVKWRQRGFRKGSLIAVNNHLLILSENGNKLALAEINSESYKEKAQMAAFPNTRCWSVPTIANNCIYLRNEEEIMCINFLK
ncbi:PQQ-binding-like beta-propeller repeat protein [Candidatus Uabimicrobium amorphum]|uniref:Alcohol dehydrogenase n=1 Tax=Uabimicrobium amorphum TaxID=2596890 RepID=A0A5S9F3Y9_UABAM|nr:PQQ-binding-like beta-propeller repeat protein [Candidatus Uabimicrobium amorphum]BBM83914.1 alcohol dehydrogenase [Candidatus Uabimicrobium amorphum]